MKTKIFAFIALAVLLTASCSPVDLETVPETETLTYTRASDYSESLTGLTLYADDDLRMKVRPSGADAVLYSKVLSFTSDTTGVFYYAEKRVGKFAGNEVISMENSVIKVSDEYSFTYTYKDGKIDFYGLEVDRLTTILDNNEVGRRAFVSGYYGDYRDINGTQVGRKCLAVGFVEKDLNGEIEKQHYINGKLVLAYTYFE